jgi:hypothetical protein
MNYFNITTRLLVCLLYGSVLFAQEVSTDTFNLVSKNYDKKNIQVLQQIRGKGKKSVCSFIMDGEHNLFLVKQTTYKEASGALLAVRDMLGADIAQRSGISANHVQLIPGNISFPGKLRHGIAATVHLLVPGYPLSKKSGLFIQQPLKSYISKKLWGISFPVVQSMATHPDLAQITALDTFIGNAARRNNSYFYDEETDRFFAIDLESGFKNPLADLACIFFKKLIGDKKLVLTDQEVAGLVMYRDTLITLINNNSVKQQHAQLDYLIKSAGINSRDGDVQKLISLYKTTIKDNYNKSQELAVLVDRLIAQHAGKTVAGVHKGCRLIPVLVQDTYLQSYQNIYTQVRDSYSQSGYPEMVLDDMARKIAAYTLSYGN